MSSLFALLSQQNTNLQTRNGLIVLGLQNDFIAPDGKLPVRDTSFLDRLTTLVSDFREHGDVIWIRSLFEDTRPVNGLSSVGDTVIVGGHAGQDADLPASSKKTKKKKKKNKVAWLWMVSMQFPSLRCAGSFQFIDDLIILET